MKRSKKLLAVLCAGAVTLSACAFAACDKTPAHDHNDHLSYVTEGWDTHYGKCSEDDFKTESENHTFGSDNKCTKCGQAKKVNVTSVTVSGENSVKVGASITLTAAVAPADASEKAVSWKISAGNTFATLSDKGVLTGVAPGSVTVTATADGKSGNKTVNVVPATHLAEAYVCIDDAGAGNSAQIAVSHEASDTVSVVSKNADIATAAYADGKVTVTAVGSGKAIIEVTVGADKEELTAEVATAGLTYEYMTSDDGDEYIQVSDGDDRTSTEVYIPGFRFSEEANEGEGAYLPVTHIKSAATADGATFTDNAGGFYESNVTKVYTGDNVTVIGGRAFQKSASLQEVTFGENLKHIMGYAFSETAVVKIDLIDMEALSAIDREAFSNCSALTEIIIPKNVEHIGDGAFRLSPQLSTIKILSEQVKVLYGSTFMNAADNLNLTIWLPSSITTIADNAFMNYGGAYNDSTITVYYSGTEEQYNAISCFQTDNFSHTSLDPNRNGCTVHYNSDFEAMLNPTPEA